MENKETIYFTKDQLRVFIKRLTEEEMDKKIEKLHFSDTL